MTAPARFIDYFVVCGLGPELQTLVGQKGFHGTSSLYQPALIDQYPPVDHVDGSPPPQLPLCVLPGGVHFYQSGPSPTDQLSHARSYPIILTDGEGSKICVSCVAFRDPIDEDIALAYRIPTSVYADKCICIVSHWPFFEAFRGILEEIHRLCFSPQGCSKPLWELISHLVTAVPLPTPGSTQVLFAVENHLLSVEGFPRDGLPYADMSFQPLIQCLDIDNVVRLFTCVLLEKRCLLRASKYSLLTVVAEAVCHLIYPVKWQHVYIPVLPYAGVDYIDAPTPYLMGLHSGVRTSGLTMDGVVVVDLDNNRIITSEDIPPIPEPELGHLRMAILQLVHPNLAHMDRARVNAGPIRDPRACRLQKPWGPHHDREIRLIFLKFFASILNGYRDFVDHSHTAASVFNSQAFLRKRTRITGRPSESMIVQFLGSQGFYDFLERGYGSLEAGPNVVDKMITLLAKGEDPANALQLQNSPGEIISVRDAASSTETTARRGRRFCYDRFPAAERTAVQEERRKATLAAATTTVSPANAKPPQSHHSPAADNLPEHHKPGERQAEWKRMVHEIKVKQASLWRKFLDLTEDPASSSQYGTLQALIESDAEGIAGSGFVECISEHISEGWNGKLSDDHFAAVRELLKLVVTKGWSRNDMPLVTQVLLLAFYIHREDISHTKDYIQRHLGVLSVFEDPRVWDYMFEGLMDQAADRTGNHQVVVADQLSILAQHMSGLMILDGTAWSILDNLAQRNNVGYKHLVKLRGVLAHLMAVKSAYWGMQTGRQQARTQGLQQPQQPQQPVPDPNDDTRKAATSWVQSMFGRERPNLLARNERKRHASVSEPRSPPAAAGAEAAHGGKDDLWQGGGQGQQRRGPTVMRLLRGHKGPVTSLYSCSTAELGSMEDNDLFISGSADCTVKIWNPAFRTKECIATLDGHKGAVRCIGTDRTRVVAGADTGTVIVWEKASSQVLVELKGHSDKVGCLRVLPAERVLTASHDSTVKMWDVRSDSCVSTIADNAGPVLCFDFDDVTSTLATAGVDGICRVWDVRAGKEKFKLTGHTNWIRCLKMVGDVIVTGSDDWTARVWSATTSQCEAVLACHSGAVTCIEYAAATNHIITGSADCMVRLWEREDVGTGTMRCVETVGVHSAGVLSVQAGEKWLGIGASDNSMSLFHNSLDSKAHHAPSTPRSSLSKSDGATAWQLLRTLQRSAALVRCVAVDVSKGRLCSGGRNGVLRLWEPSLPVDH